MCRCELLLLLLLLAAPHQSQAAPAGLPQSAWTGKIEDRNAHARAAVDAAVLRGGATTRASDAIESGAEYR
jgi:hypothetical protein